MLQRRMLSAEDEKAGSETENEVRREDQERINKFSRLHQREEILKSQLTTKAKEKEDLADLTTELELILDDDEKIPYKIGDSFFMLPLSDIQERISTSSDQIDKEVSDLEDKLSTIREEMQELKVSLYARFGRSINLEI